MPFALTAGHQPQHEQECTTKSILERNMDWNGVWHFDGVTFSIRGRIDSTVKRLAATGEAGWSEAELEDYLHLIPKNLAELAGKGAVKCSKVGHKYVYLSDEETKRPCSRAHKAAPSPHR